MSRVWVFLWLDMNCVERVDVLCEDHANTRHATDGTFRTMCPKILSCPGSKFTRTYNIIT